MDSLEFWDFLSFIIFSDEPWSLLVSFRQLFKLPLVVQCCDVICCLWMAPYLLLLLPHNWSPVHASNWIVTNKCLMSNNWVFSTISVFVLVRWWRVTDYYLVRIFWFVFARLKLISVGTWAGWCNHILTPRPQPQSTHSSIQWLQLNTQLELQTFLWFSRSQRRPLLPVLSHLRHY